MRMILVRHGESVGNFENRLQGQEDYDLTDLGKQQALRTADRLKELGASAVYSSHLLRAHNTAQTIAGRLEVSPMIIEDVSEYHFGEMSGATYAEVRERFGAIANPAERIYPGEEGREVFYDRVTKAIWGIADKHPDETVAVVSHGGPIALFCQAALGLPYKRPMPFSIDNCSLNLIDIGPAEGLVRPMLVVRLNDVCHLAGLQ
ncbi:MAG TPA: histidine phosphatase family protein [Dehalococcoidia bacterium]|jgi:broad specificity phosphatase PhoE|nr:histidine phosphatase family protein [Dehalococcoidia bacterium]